jgi:hypothetical protein
MQSTATRVKDGGGDLHCGIGVGGYSHSHSHSHSHSYTGGGRRRARPLRNDGVGRLGLPGLPVLARD